MEFWFWIFPMTGIVVILTILLINAAATVSSIFDSIAISPQPKPVKEAKTKAKFKAANSRRTVKPSNPVKVVKPSNITSDEDINLVVSGLVHLGVKKSKARRIVAKMCKDKCYDDTQKLFEACFPYIN